MKNKIITNQPIWSTTNFEIGTKTQKVTENWEKEEEEENAEKWVRRSKRDYQHYWLPKSLIHSIKNEEKN